MRLLPGIFAGRLSGHGRSLQEVRGALAGTVFVSFTGQALLVVSGVLVARLLGPEDRGRLALVVLVPVIVVQLVSLGIPVAVTYFTATGASPRRMLRQLRGTVAIQAIVGCLLATAGFGVLAVVDSLHVGLTVVVAVLALPGMLLIGYGLAPLQGAKRFLAFNVLRQSPAAIYAAGVVGLYLADLDNVGAVTVVWSGSCVLVGIVALALATRLRGGTEDPPGVKALLRFGLRGYVGASSPIEAYRLDQVTIGIFLSPVSLGLYVVALAFTNLPQFIAQSIGTVAYPHIAGMQDRAAAWRAIKEYVLVTSVITILVCGVLALFADRLVLLFFGEAFESSIDVTRVLLVGAAIVSIRRLLGDAARGIGMPGAASIAEVAAWVALLPALAICIPLWGLVGVAVALTLSYGVSLAVLIALVIRHRTQEGDLTEVPMLNVPTFVPEA